MWPSNSDAALLTDGQSILRGLARTHRHRRGRVAGGFAEPVRLALARDPALIAEIARRILNAHFPESIRQDVADAVGLCLDADNAAAPEQAQRRRDPAFREKVLLAYEYRCCVCGHDLRMGGHEWVGTTGP